MKEVKDEYIWWFFWFQLITSINKRNDKNIIKEEDDFFLKCFLKHGFDYEDIIVNREDFRMITDETRAGVSLYTVFYKGEVLFKIRKTLVSNKETDGLSFKTYLEEVLDE